MSQAIGTKQTSHITMGGRTHKVSMNGDEPAQVDGVSLAVEARLLSPGVLSLLLTLPDGRTQSFRCIADPATATEPAAVLIDGVRIPYTLSDPRSLRAASSGAADSGPRALKAPMPGRIVRVLVADGEAVEAGQGCVVIEAMKMQNELKAPRAGQVTKLTATAGETVASGANLLIIV